MVWLTVAVVVFLWLASTGRITTIDIILFCTIVPSIVLHEIAHGVVALACGDDTAKRAGRLTLNPLKHIDPLGTIILPAIMILAGFGWFGWAKPVPVNLGKLRHPRNQGVLVSLAGPATNVVLAAAAAGVFRLLGGPASITADGGLPLWGNVLFYGGLINLWLAAFNMLPIPPLDGSVLLERLLPRRLWPKYLRIRPYTLPILVAVVLVAATFHSTALGNLELHTEVWWGHVLGLQIAA